MLPPVLFGGGIAAGFLLVARPRSSRPAVARRARRRSSGRRLALLGLAFGGWAFATFVRARTTPHPNHPVTALVTWGPYRSRATRCTQASRSSRPVSRSSRTRRGSSGAPSGLAHARRLVIDREEAYLERRFGDTTARSRRARAAGSRRRPSERLPSGRARRLPSRERRPRCGSPRPRYSFGTPFSSGAHVKARLDREDHAGLELPRRARAVAIPPPVVHVEAEPVRRVMEREALGGVLLRQRRAPALAGFRLQKRVEEDVPRRLVRRVPGRAGLDCGDRGALGRQDRSVQARARGRVNRPEAGNVRVTSDAYPATSQPASTRTRSPAPSAARVLDVMEHRRVLAGGDDRRIRRAARAIARNRRSTAASISYSNRPGPRRPLGVAVRRRPRSRPRARGARSPLATSRGASRGGGPSGRRPSRDRASGGAPRAGSGRGGPRRGGRSSPRGRTRDGGRAPCGRGRGGGGRARRPGGPAAPNVFTAPSGPALRPSHVSRSRSRGRTKSVSVRSPRRGPRSRRARRSRSGRRGRGPAVAVVQRRTRTRPRGWRRGARRPLPRVEEAGAAAGEEVGRPWGESNLRDVDDCAWNPASSAASRRSIPRNPPRA